MGLRDGSVSTTRGVSSVVAVVLLVAVTVVLAGTVFVFVDGAAQGLRQPAPQVAQSSVEFPTQSGFADGVVRVTHRGGDPVPVANVRVQVDTSDVAGCDTDSAEILNLPSTRSGLGNLGYGEENFAAGDDSPIDEGGPDAEWSAGALHADTGPNFVVGDSFAFRLTPSECPVAPGETVRVTVVHEPSKQVVFTVTATARDGG